MGVFKFFLYLILTIAVVYGLYRLWMMILKKRVSKEMTWQELNEQIRKTQVIDVREAPEFESKHILGARNIPFSQFKMRAHEIRKDLPICLYDENGFFVVRAANILHKNGYPKVYILKGGIENWFGKVKTQ